MKLNINSAEMSDQPRWATWRIWSLLLSLACLCPGNSWALGFRIPNQDAEAIARGNAFVATANNPSALYYNPAGITQLQGHNLQVGTHILSVNAEYISPTGREVDSETPNISPVPQLYYTYSLEKLPLSFGLGIYAPYGLALEWPEDSGFRTLALEGELTYMTINPMVAYKVAPTLSVAIGPTINYADLMLRQGMLVPGDEFKFDGDDLDFGFTAGILWQPHEKWSFGAKYHSATTMDLSGHSETHSLVPLLPSARTSSSTELPFAQFVVGGISYRPTRKWNIEVNVDWADWEEIDQLDIKSTPLGDLSVPLNWRSSFLYEAGVSHYFDNGYWVAGGYFFSQRSTTERNFNPVLPDTDLHVGSLGVGYKGRHWRWALSGQLITGPARRISTSQSTSLIGESANGKYSWFNQSVDVSVGYHF